MKLLLDKLKTVSGWTLFLLVMSVFLGLSLIFSEIKKQQLSAVGNIETLRTPFAHKGDQVPVDKLRQGDYYFANYQMKYPNVCERVTVQSRLSKIEPDTGQVIDGVKVTARVYHSYQPSYTSIRTTGIYEVNEGFQLPPRLPVGLYNHQRILFVVCDGFASTEAFPVIPIELID